ncbi:MAG TPA: MOSC domain-containing protein, partial [Halomonas sp.]|nr:MOSC domain-containing protein [Halomonas sp.]
QTGTIPTQAEPLKTLLALNTQPHLKGAHFGQNATLTAGEGGVIRVGEVVSVTPR